MKFPSVLGLVLLLPLLAGCGQKVAERMIVQIDYRGTLPDGTVFDESTEGEPLEFMYGVGMMPTGLEAGLAGLRAGDKKTIEVKAADAYGERNDAAIQEVPRDQLPADMELEVGGALSAQTPDGTIYATITEIRDSIVVLDFNHPLAGKDLTFDVTVVGVRRPTVEEANQYQVE